MEEIDNLFDNDPAPLLPGGGLEEGSHPSMEMLESLFKNNDDLDLRGTSEEELRMRASLLHSAEYGIRDSVKSQVEDVRWLKDVTKQLDEAEKNQAASQTEGTEEMGRCAVCTLPIGSCQHTNTWMESSLTSQRHAVADDALQNEINGVLGLLDTGGVQLNTSHQHGDIDLDTIRWSLHAPRLADKIGAAPLPSQPCIKMHIVCL